MNDYCSYLSKGPKLSFFTLTPSDFNCLILFKICWWHISFAIPSIREQLNPTISSFLSHKTNL